MIPTAVPVASALVRRRLVDYLVLVKPRVVTMVLVTTVVGYYLGSIGATALAPLVHTLVGTALAAAGTLGLNQVLERESDARMERTRDRPLPAGRLATGEATLVATALLAGGLVELALTVGTLAAATTAVIAVVYLFVYTPLKAVTPLCSVVGAVPGALPPVVGWVAARGSLDVEAWILFAIMFVWQIPHTLAIGCVYREDYARAGIRVLPVVDRDGASTGRQAVSNCLALVPIALLPTLVGLAGPLYFGVALVLGLGFLWTAVALARSRSAADARRLLFASLVYLPVLLAAMAFDKLTP